MGTIAARLLQSKLRTLFQIQAILCLSVAQAVDIMVSNSSEMGFSESTILLRRFIRDLSPTITEDRPLGRDIEALASALAVDAPPSA